MHLFLSLVLAASQPAGAANPAPAPASPAKGVPSGKLTTAEPQSIASYLQRAGYRAKIVTDDGAPYIESATNGANFYVNLLNCNDNAPCEDLMFRSSYDKRTENPVKLETINTFNEDHRWARAYLDKQGDPVIEMDVLFTDRLIDEKMFEEALSLWSRSLGSFHEAIGF